jgi:UDP-N-acetylmuramyl pentapeptide synthase
VRKFVTSSTLSYLRYFAREALKAHQPTIIGIAGSVGKSSTRKALEAVLMDHFPTKAVGNSETGIPLGILGMTPENYSPLDWLKMLAKSPFNMGYLKGTKYLIAEMGIDEPDPPKNMDYLLSILKPDIAISLNVSATHSLQFDKTVKKEGLSQEDRLQEVITNIAREDTKIITQSHCKLGIYNADDKDVTSQIDGKELSSKLLTFGTKSTCDISYGLYRVSLKGSSFDFFVKMNGNREEISLTFNRHILPQEYREVFAASILIGIEAGLTLEQIKLALEKNYAPPKGRASVFEGINKSTIIDSSYNASKASITAFLDLIDILKKETNREVSFLFGDMRELGNESRIEHEEVAKKLIGIVDYLYLVGPLTREFVLPIIQENEKGFKEVRWFDNSLRAGEYLKDNLPKETLLLAKGSQNTIFLEEAVKQLLEDKKDSKNLCRQEEFWMKLKLPAKS